MTKSEASQILAHRSGKRIRQNGGCESGIRSDKAARGRAGGQRFTVTGRAVGYYTSGARPNWTRLKSYRSYKERVQWTASAAGIRLPLEATEVAPLIISTRLFCSSRVHHDPENVHKGIVDALFYGAKGGDKHVGGSFRPATYGGDDLVEVEIHTSGIT